MSTVIDFPCLRAEASQWHHSSSSSNNNNSTMDKLDRNIEVVLESLEKYLAVGDGGYK